ncbi:MAG: twin-arginine translocase subunit TatB [Acidobacteria bacterium]|nr:twin-arginine translocase subunit TatB [Acidobacteriota bacterium]MBI3657780.1 twin-arginine translocase subunit TatB [Acidobacteriota bacterium]
MGNLGFPELMLIFVIALIVFGPKKLPELGKSIGKGLAEFRRASNELRNTWEEEVRVEDLRKFDKIADPHDDYNKVSEPTAGGNPSAGAPTSSTPTGEAAPAATAKPITDQPEKS